MNNSLAQKNSNGVIVSFYLLTIIAMYSINIGNNSISAVLYIILAIILLLSRIETNVLLFFCITPFPRVFLIKPSFFTLIPIIEIVIIGKYFISNKYNKLYAKSTVLCGVIFIYSAIIEVLRFDSFLSTIQYVLKLLVIIVISSIGNKELTKRCFCGLVFSSIFSIFAVYVFPNLSATVALYMSDYSKRFNGLLGDPGEFGQLLICTIACCISYYVIKADNCNRKIKGNEYLVIGIVSAIAIYCMLLSGTRTCVVGLAFTYLSIVLWLINGKNKNTILIGLFALAVTVVFGYYLWQIVFSLFMKSHGGESISEDNRLHIWLNYWNVFKSDFSIQLFGVGMECSNRYAALHSLGNPHNIIIEKIFECGLVGLILNTLFFVSVLKDKNISIFRKSNLPFYAMLSTLFFYGSVGIELIYFLIGLILPRCPSSGSSNVEELNKSKDNNN